MIFCNNQKYKNLEINNRFNFKFCNQNYRIFFSKRSNKGTLSMKCILYFIKFIEKKSKKINRNE